jgi:hypothetical protein
MLAPEVCMQNEPEPWPGGRAGTCRILTMAQLFNLVTTENVGRLSADIGRALESIACLRHNGLCGVLSPDWGLDWTDDGVVKCTVRLCADTDSLSEKVEISFEGSFSSSASPV